MHFVTEAKPTNNKLLIPSEKTHIYIYTCTHNNVEVISRNQAHT